MTEQSRLHISEDFSLPLDAVTDTFGLLAKRGAGKTNAAVAMAEEMFANGLPWVAIDPVGSWWGIRAAGDGGPGLPVLVFGGEHGDLPLEPGSGRMVADLVVDQNLTCVLDISLMDEEDELPQFVTDFLRRLFQRNTDPRHLFFEEAEVILPQTVTRTLLPMFKAGNRIVKLGRGRGLGVTLITQRSASLNKNVLTQMEVLIALRTTAPTDQAAIQAWVKHHETGAEAVSQLARLSDGEAFVINAQAANPVHRVQFRRRHTYDSGATPKVGQQVRPPADLASIDLGALREAMAATIERAEADDPALLRARIAELEAQLGEPRVEVRTVPDPAHVGALAGLAHLLDAVGGNLAQTARNLLDSAGEIRGLNLDPAGMNGVQLTGQEPPAAAKEGGAGRVGRSAAGQSPNRQVNGTAPGTANTGKRDPAGTGGDAPPGPDGPIKLGRAETAVLRAVLQRPGSTPAVVGFLASYSPKSSSFQNALGRLRTLGLVERGQPLRALPGAREVLGDFEPLPTGDELRRFWLSKLGKAERAVLESLIQNYPMTMTRDELSRESGYAAGSSSFDNALGRLRSLGLCVRGQLRATEDLMDALGVRV